MGWWIVVGWMPQLLAGTVHPELPPSIPVAGRPADFSGAVGQFRLRAAASPTTLTAGEAVEYTLEIVGSGELENVRPPQLDRQPLFAEHFAQIEPPATVDRADGRAFRYRLLVKSPVDRIPAARLSFYNPQTQRFELAVAEAISLTVRPAATLAAEGVIDVQSPAATTDDTERPWEFVVPIAAAAVVLWLTVQRRLAKRTLAKAHRGLAEAPAVSDRDDRPLAPLPRFEELPADPEQLFLLTRIAQEALAERLRLKPGQRTAEELIAALGRTVVPQASVRRFADLVRDLERERFAAPGTCSPPSNGLIQFFDAYRAIAEGFADGPSVFGSASNSGDD